MVRDPHSVFTSYFAAAGVVTSPDNPARHAGRSDHLRHEPLATATSDFLRLTPLETWLVITTVLWPDRLDGRYNGHPDFAHMSEEFATALASSDTVAVVGVGNVALDCARILAKGEKGSRHWINDFFPARTASLWRCTVYAPANKETPGCHVFELCAVETRVSCTRMNSLQHHVCVPWSQSCVYIFCFQPYKSALAVPMPTGAGALKDTDICDHALDVLSSAGAGPRRVVILGRRGHVQASFTIKVNPQA